jgi:hypothetical protein
VRTSHREGRDDDVEDDDEEDEEDEEGEENVDGEEEDPGRVPAAGKSLVWLFGL